MIYICVEMKSFTRPVNLLARITTATTTAFPTNTSTSSEVTSLHRSMRLSSEIRWRWPVLPQYTQKNRQNDTCVIQGVGWMMWTMKTEDQCAPEWDFTMLLEKGVIPANLCERETFIALSLDGEEHPGLSRSSKFTQLLVKCKPSFKLGIKYRPSKTFKSVFFQFLIFSSGVCNLPSSHNILKVHSVHCL